MSKAIHFGAGKIGRGFIGSVLNEAGYEVTFADVNQEIIDLINKEKGYAVHITGQNVYTKEIVGVSAVNSASEDLLHLIAEADLITTAVSMKVIPLIAPAIASGLNQRYRSCNTSPLNIICCENGIRATSTLKGYVMERLDAETIEWMKGMIGFADSSVDRIVPMISLESPLDVAVEEFYEWNVDRNQLVGSIMHVPGMNLTDNLDACVEKKLFTLNTGHCTTAFLGMMKGYTYIHEAITDPDIQAIARRVMHQSGAALIKKFGIDPDCHKEYVDIIVKRFSSHHLKDLVTRVGHDPVRKLGPNLYFAYPMKMAMEYGLPYDSIALAAAAALHCNNPEDPQSVQIRKMVAESGAAETFAEISGIGDESAVNAVAEAYGKLLITL
jgi:mannitol-1-phosphate 5-dehydrogenase